MSDLLPFEINHFQLGVFISIFSSLCIFFYPFVHFSFTIKACGCTVSSPMIINDYVVFNPVVLPQHINHSPIVGCLVFPNLLLGI